MNSVSTETTVPVEERTYRFRKAFPEPLKTAFRRARATQQLSRAFAYDTLRFFRYSGVFSKQRDEGARRADLTKYYHMIEKGLALPAPRPGFGQQVNQDLCKKVLSALKAGNVGPEVQYAVDALAGYSAFNAQHGVAQPGWLTETLEAAKAHGIEVTGDPTRAPRVQTPIPADDALGFILSRHSVRQFGAGEVATTVLENAALAAQSAPCVCNRQASKVYFVRDPDLKAKMLARQNGNRGFGDRASVVGLVTVDLRAFLEPTERFQAWIDGGLFTMNLLLGVHAQGHGACCLNWSASPEQDKLLRQLNIIPPHETVITMVAIGTLPEQGFVVARSARRSLDDVMAIL